MENCKKLCWYCKYFYYSHGSPAYSEYTPGEDFTMSCQRKHWVFDSFKTSQQEFGSFMEKATVCIDFAEIVKATTKPLDRDLMGWKQSVEKVLETYESKLRKVSADLDTVCLTLTKHLQRSRRK